MLFKEFFAPQRLMQTSDECILHSKNYQVPQRLMYKNIIYSYVYIKGIKSFVFYFIKPFLFPRIKTYLLPFRRFRQLCPLLIGHVSGVRPTWYIANKRICREATRSFPHRHPLSGPLLFSFQPTHFLFDLETNLSCTPSLKSSIWCSFFTLILLAFAYKNISWSHRWLRLCWVSYICIIVCCILIEKYKVVIIMVCTCANAIRV